jgi:hypothetical protein
MSSGGARRPPSDGRHGNALLTEVRPQVRALLELVGLGELFGEPGRKPEGGEDPSGVLERVEPDDPAI